MEGSGLRPPLVVDLSSDSDDEGGRSGTSRWAAPSNSSCQDLGLQAAPHAAAVDIASTLAGLAGTCGGALGNEQLLHAGGLVGSSAPEKEIFQPKCSPGTESDDDDCCILEEDPDKVNSQTEPKEDNDEELVVTRATGPVACRDFPHARHSCATFPFDKTLHMDHCPQCHCYVCDVLVPECASWGLGTERDDHCNASDKELRWKAMRRNKKGGGGVLPGVLQSSRLPVAALAVPQRPVALRHMGNGAVAATAMPTGLAGGMSGPAFFNHPAQLIPPAPSFRRNPLVMGVGNTLASIPSELARRGAATQQGLGGSTAATWRSLVSQLQAPTSQTNGSSHRETPMWASTFPAQMGSRPSSEMPPLTATQQAQMGFASPSPSASTYLSNPPPSVTGTKRRRQHATNTGIKQSNGARNELLEARLAEASEDARANGLSNRVATTASGTPINFAHFPSVHNAQQVRAQRAREAVAAAGAAAGGNPQTPPVCLSRMPDESALRAFLDLPSLDSLTAGADAGPASLPNISNLATVQGAATSGGLKAAFAPAQQQQQQSRAASWHDRGHEALAALQSPRVQPQYLPPSMGRSGAAALPPGGTAGTTQLALGTTAITRPWQPTAASSHIRVQRLANGSSSSGTSTSTGQAAMQGAAPALGVPMQRGGASSVASRPATAQHPGLGEGSASCRQLLTDYRQLAARGNQQLLANQQLLVRLQEQQKQVTRQQQLPHQPSTSGVASLASGLAPNSSTSSRMRVGPAQHPAQQPAQQPASTSPSVSHLGSSAVGEGAGPVVDRPASAGQVAPRPGSAGTAIGYAQRGLSSLAPSGARLRDTAAAPQEGERVVANGAVNLVDSVTANMGRHRLHAGHYPVVGRAMGPAAWGVPGSVNAAYNGITQANQHPEMMQLAASIPGTAMTTSYGQPQPTMQQPARAQPSSATLQPAALAAAAVPVQYPHHPGLVPAVTTTMMHQSYPSNMPAWQAVPCTYMPPASTATLVSSPLQQQLQTSTGAAAAHASSSPKSSAQLKSPVNAANPQCQQPNSPVNVNSQQHVPMTVNQPQSNGEGAGAWPFAKETAAAPWPSFLSTGPSDIMLEPQGQDGGGDNGLGLLSLWPSDLMDPAGMLSSFVASPPRPRFSANIGETFQAGARDCDGGLGSGNLDSSSTRPTSSAGSEGRQMPSQMPRTPPVDSQRASCHVANGCEGGAHVDGRGGGVNGGSVLGGEEKSDGAVSSEALEGNVGNVGGMDAFANGYWPSIGSEGGGMGLDVSCGRGNGDGGGVAERLLGSHEAGPCPGQSQSARSVGGDVDVDWHTLGDHCVPSLRIPSNNEGHGGGVTESGDGCGSSGHMGGAQGEAFASEVGLEMSGLGVGEGSSLVGVMDVEIEKRTGDGCLGDVQGDAGDQTRNATGGESELGSPCGGGIGLNGLDLQPSPFSASQPFDYGGEVAWPCWV